jgi:hypothetical protein
MTTTQSEDDVCQTCGKTLGWHRENDTRHPFNFGQDGATDFLKRRGARDPQRDGKSPQRGAEMPLMGGDPVLRIALINRGVLSPADLIVAETQLREALLAVQQEGPDAQSPEGSRRGQV